MRLVDLSSLPTSAGTAETAAPVAPPPSPVPPSSTVAPRARSRSLRITARRNDDKMGPFVAALQAAGHQFVAGPGDVTLTDVEMPGPIYGDLLDLNDIAVIYPHGPGPVMFNDGMFESHPNVVANFVIGEGPADALRSFGYPAEVVSVGWPYGELVPFRATEARRVLFAPVHPDGFGYLARDIRAANRCALESLIETGTDITVRHVGSLRSNGLRWLPDVDFAPARLPNGEIRPAEDDIDAADVVVALGTFAYRSIARGVPTVKFCQRRWNNDFRFAGQPVFNRRWSLYAPDIVYPIDLGDGDAATALKRAANDDAEIEDWRRRFIGDPFDPVAFVASFEAAVERRRR